jgi:hypothetical protein
MPDLNKEEIYMALYRVKSYIEDMSPEEFEKFMWGNPIFGTMLRADFQLIPLNIDTHVRRSITRLEFRIS